MTLASLPGEDGVVRLIGGRRIAYRRFGAKGGAPLIALHGTPGSRIKFIATDALATDLGITVYAPDRWGYGGTYRHPAATLAAFAADMLAFADRLEFARFAVMGVSGGGPYAAATAAEAGRRATALALVAPVGPIAGEPDARISAFHRFCFGPFARTTVASRAVFHGFRGLLQVSRDAGMRAAMVRVSPPDRRTLAVPGVAARLGDSFIEGLKPGVEGPVTDLMLFSRPWRIDLGGIGCPVCLWIGDEDRNVPVSAALRLPARLPGCRVVEIPGEGHLWIARHYGEVLRWLADAAKPAKAP